MFAVNDIVNYGTTGVCQIVDLVFRQFDGESRQYFVLRPMYDEKATIFVPTWNEALLAKMRRVLSVEEVYDMIRDMPDEQEIWIDDERERQEKYKEILNSGDRRKIVQLIKALYTHQQAQLAKGRKLRASDERIMKEAERILYAEFALVLDLTPEQVLPFIMNQLQVSQK